MQELSRINLATVIVLIILLNFLYNLIKPYLNKISNHIINKYLKKKQSEDLVTLVHEDHDRMAKYEENRINDRKQSLEIQEKLVKAIEDINKKIDEFKEDTNRRFEENKERENKRTRAELKDRISQSYRYYHEKGSWTSMEKESLEDLITEYESAGGDNSFVHSKVQQEMYTWELIG